MKQDRPTKRLAHSATSRETVALVKWSLASNVKLSEGVSGEKNVLVLFLRPPGHWLHRSLKNFELSERKEGRAFAAPSPQVGGRLPRWRRRQRVQGAISLREFYALFRLHSVCLATDLHRGGLIGRGRSPLPPMDNFGDVVGKLCPS